MAKVARKRKAANGYKLAEPLPKGEILEDISKNKWRLGPSIGCGGFGEIYSAQDAKVASTTKFPYVIKIEPHTNGPLFVEMHFYMRNGKPEDVYAFKKEKGLKMFGMPLYLGSGSHEFKGEKYRFVVMEKFGIDIWKIFLENNKSFPCVTVFKLAVQILNVLEYIHKRGYVHADIKGANILLGDTKEAAHKQVYLVDFGLATKFTVEKEYKPNPKKAHDGTIEYLSIDAHKGVQTRRGDLEILAYNVIQWLGCILPWEKLKDPSSVQKSKEEHMENIQKLTKSCFKEKSPPDAIVEFLKYLKTLKFDTEPDYKKVRNIFIAGIKNAGGSLDGPLDFTSKIDLKNIQSKSPKRKSSRARKVERLSEDEEDGMQVHEDNDEVVEEMPKEVKGKRRRIGNDTEVVKPPIKKRGRPKNVAQPKISQPDTEETEPDDLNDPYEGYTDAMKEIMKKKLQSGKSKVKKKPVILNVENGMEGYTDSMKEVMQKKKDRLANKRPTRGNKTDSDSIPIVTTSKSGNKKEFVTLRRKRTSPPNAHSDLSSDSE